MFSVNVDKIVEMTDKERESYESLSKKMCESFTNKHYKLAVTGGGIKAFKLAYSIVQQGNRVLFVDGDISSEVFLGKYKLGKNMHGLVDYIKKPQKKYDLLCKSNEDKLDIIFTGTLDDGYVSDEEEMIMKSLLAKYENDYDMIVADSDPDGRIAKYCDGTMVIIDRKDYDEDSIAKYIEKLENSGCEVLGVIINE